jgi:hypothetical protein
MQYQIEDGEKYYSSIEGSKIPVSLESAVLSEVVHQIPIPEDAKVDLSSAIRGLRLFMCPSPFFIQSRVSSMA